MNEEPTPFVVRLADGAPQVLKRGYPRERALEYAERLGRAVESNVAQLFGDGLRNPVPLDIDHYIEGESRLHAARMLGEYELDLVSASALEFGDLTFPLLRARVVARSPTDTGFRVTTRFFSAQHEFTDGTGVAVPLI
ncbi:hypothetical protein [Deinococcus aquatilis]|uniref:hypothetical protein n=1 Tax=Deinococcus aquatilis TaxID=519440 RepID=UPI000382E2EE|nr:hypothetical protein [Deinococcus aquatilis]